MDTGPIRFPARLDRRTEAAVRHLRTLLAEARNLLQSSPVEPAALLDRRIEQLQQEAESLAPDLGAGTIRNGVSGS